MSGRADYGRGHSIAVRVNADHMIDKLCKNNHLPHPGHSAGHASQHHLAAQHAESLTIVLRPATKNDLNKKRWHSRQELRLEIVTWIERTYHRRRRQRRLGGLTPIKFEIVNTPAAHAA